MFFLLLKPSAIMTAALPTRPTRWSFFSPDISGSQIKQPVRIITNQATSAFSNDLGDGGKKINYACWQDDRREALSPGSIKKKEIRSVLIIWLDLIKTFWSAKHLLLHKLSKSNIQKMCERSSTYWQWGNDCNQLLLFPCSLNPTNTFKPYLFKGYKMHSLRL